MTLLFKSGEGEINWTQFASCNLICCVFFCLDRRLGLG
jgi:hypothetical protein